MEVFAEVEKDLKEGNINQSVDGIVGRTLSICSSKNIAFPTRMTMERNILRLMYPYDDGLVRSFYTKSFPTY